MTKVVNIRKDKYDIYIGRAGQNQDGYYGNPHVIGYCKICKRFHDRKDAIQEYKNDFYKRLEDDVMFKVNILLLKGKTLGCFCKPAPCHGDVIVEYLQSIK